MEVILVFSTGRSGTAFLARYFGGDAADRTDWCLRSGTAVAHEPFDSMPEYWKAVRECKSNGNACLPDRVWDGLREQEVSRFLITDNKLGRWFIDEFLRSNIDTKVIYLYRDENAVVRSIRRTEQALGTVWRYESEDASLLTGGVEDAVLLHVKETAAKWKATRQKLRPEQYMEISLENFTQSREVRHQVEQFVGLEGIESFVSKKVNASMAGVGLLGYQSLFRVLRGKAKSWFWRVSAWLQARLPERLVRLLRRILKR